MNTAIRESNTEALYTLEAARCIIQGEYRAKRINKAYFIKQRLRGLILAIIAVIIPFILDGDITGSIVAFLLGIWLLVTKDKVMMWR